MRPLKSSEMLYRTLLYFLCLEYRLTRIYSEPLRDRRQGIERYLVDTVIVVDDFMYSRFESWFSNKMAETRQQVSKQQTDAKIKEYVALLIHQVNSRLDTLGLYLPVSLQLQLVNIILHVNILEVPVGQMNTSQALDRFTNYIRTNGLGQSYDHAILLTGYKFENEMGTADRGRAYVGALCDSEGSSASVVEDIGGFQGAFFVAHEFGHSAGAQHDGEGSSVTCSSSQRYLMTPILDEETSSYAHHPWYFSQCSANGIHSIIKVLVQSSSSRHNCFNINSAPMEEFRWTENVVAGQLYPATDQCKMIYGNQSLVCIGATLRQSQTICTALYCVDPSQSNETGKVRCVKHFAAEGTSCGDNMWCQMGQCVTSSAAPLLGYCPYGNRPVLINNGTCNEIINDNPFMCYRTDVYSDCCASCNLVKRDAIGCEYGNRIPTEICPSSKEEAKLHCRDAMTTECCDTCHSLLSTAFSWRLHWTSSLTFVVCIFFLIGQ